MTNQETNRRRLADLVCRDCSFHSPYLYDAADHERVKHHTVSGWAVFSGGPFSGAENGAENDRVAVEALKELAR